MINQFAFLTREVPLEKLKMDPQFQLRDDNGREEEEVQALVAVLKEKGRFKDPAHVVRVNDDLWLVGGHRRWEASRRCGKATLTCKVWEGTLTDARRKSLSENSDHGERRDSNTIKNAIFAACRLSQDEGFNWSGRDIARECECSHVTAAKYIKEFERLERATNSSPATPGNDDEEDEESENLPEDEPDEEEASDDSMDSESAPEDESDKDDSAGPESPTEVEELPDLDFKAAAKKAATWHERNGHCTESERLRMAQKTAVAAIQSVATVFAALGRLDEVKRTLGGLREKV